LCKLCKLPSGALDLNPKATERGGKYLHVPARQPLSLIPVFFQNTPYSNPQRTHLPPPPLDLDSSSAAPPLDSPPAAAPPLPASLDPCRAAALRYRLSVTALARNGRPVTAPLTGRTTARVPACHQTCCWTPPLESLLRDKMAICEV
jgi:hypothetical protein